MENASKALLIAAAVLIAIVLVALGVKLLGNVGNTKEKAEQIGQQIGNSIESSTGKITSSLDKLQSTGMTEKQITDFLISTDDSIDEDRMNEMMSYYKEYTLIRVYKAKDDEDPTTFSEELWTKSEIISEIPDDYTINDEFGDKDKGRYIFVIKKRN